MLNPGPPIDRIQGVFRSAWFRLPALLAASLLTLASCGGGEDDTDGAEATVLSLEEPAAPAQTPDDSAGTAASAAKPGAGDAQAASPTEASAPRDVAPTPTEASAPSGGMMEGLRALDAWHRSLLDRRSAVLDRCTHATALALRDFGALAAGGPEAQAYRAALRIEVPTALGPEFARYAQAYADGDLLQLATVLAPTPEPSPAWMAWTEALARAGLQRQEDRIAGPALGRLMRGMLNLGYVRDRVLGLRPLAETLGRRAGETLPYDEYEVGPGDSMYVIRAHYREQDRMLNYRWIADFNGLSNPNSLRQGATLKIPKQELAIEVWRGARVLAVFAGDWPIRIYAASMGREGEETPLGTFHLDICEKQPVYYGVNPALPYGNPENPLGERWLGFEEKPSYGIHGTNSEDTVGSFESEGCVRLHNADVIDLFDLVPVGTPVTIHA